MLVNTENGIRKSATSKKNKQKSYQAKVNRNRIKKWSNTMIIC